MFLYRALKKTKCNKEWINFSIKDCPALLWDDVFFLVNKPDDFLIYSSISRGDPNTGLFEGDIVYCSETNTRIGVIIYSNGFYIQNDNSNDKKVIQQGHIYVVNGDMTTMSVIINNNNRTPILFKHNNGLEFGFINFVYTECNDLCILIGKKVHSVPFNKINELINFDIEENVKIYENS